MANDDDDTGDYRKGEKRNAEPDKDDGNSSPPAKRAKVEDESEGVLPPLDNLEMLAIDYFRHQYFFESTDDLESFMSTIPGIKPNSKVGKILYKPLKEFFEEAWRLEINLSKYPESFLSIIPFTESANVFLAYKQWKKQSN